MHLKIQYQKVNTGARSTLSKRVAAYPIIATEQQSVSGCLCPSHSPHLTPANAEVDQILIIQIVLFLTVVQGRRNNMLPNAESAIKAPGAGATVLTACQATAR